MTETKKTRRQEESRARLAAAKKQQAVVERKRRVFVAGGAAVAVVIVIALIVGIGLATKHSGKASKVNVASAALVSEVTNVPASVSAKVGTGGSAELIKVPADKQLPVTGTGGKPLVLYVGAEYCPFCAAERWSIIQALSRFGTFSNLHTLYSTEDKVPTFTFYKSSYTSTYLDFQPEEIYSGTPNSSDSGYTPLQKLSSEQAKLFETYDAPPYVSSSSELAFPFIDFDNKWILSGSSYEPTVLIGSSQEKIAAQLSNPNSSYAKSIDGAANLLTAAICDSTHDTPAAVCDAAGTKAGATELAAASAG
jgi:hypothetical protein